MKISIVVPTFNRKEVLIKCINSVLSQTGTHFELIVVDDGSTDGTASVINELFAEELRLVFHQVDINSGVNFARNRGIKLAHGDYILFLDSDDELVPNSLLEVSQILEQNAYNHYLFLVSDRVNDPRLPLINTIYNYKDWINGSVIGDYIHVIRRDLIIRFPFFEQFRAFESLNWLRIAKNEPNQMFVRINISIRERDRSDSLTHGSFLINKAKIEQQYKASSLMIDMYGDDFFKIAILRYRKIIVKHIYLGMILNSYEVNRKYIDKLKGQRSLYIYIIELFNYLKLGWFFRLLLIIKNISKH